MEESKKCPILGQSKKFKNYGIYQNPMPILSQIPNDLRFLIYMINVMLGSKIKSIFVFPNIYLSDHPVLANPSQFCGVFFFLACANLHQFRRVKLIKAGIGR